MIKISSTVTKKIDGSTYSIILTVLVGLALLSPGVVAVFASEEETNRYYGNQSLKPMAKEDATAVYLPGGVKLTTESGETRYSLTDHLQSTKLVVTEENTISESVDYTPFGNSSSKSSATGYTSMTYEPETASYDYHARAYDPTTGRFFGPDAAKQSISPYSYTANNPITKHTLSLIHISEPTRPY